ncbi:hypothetical protein [Mycoplasma seminis]|uniref:Uncharacterized protein n=1 Tax=Mycoplasma seminis TaxID=512749 RepID=A0ABY9HAN6_9MOLU|nr:hypothetical protein [Mycoplasma seminis]WLP85245.1 hypothetical protein Q8852_02895 [Mycoplasma seminis]
MDAKVIEILAGTSSGGLLIALVYIVYISIKNSKGKNISAESKNNININSEHSDAVNILVNNLKELNNKVDDIKSKINEMEASQQAYSTAFKIYVDNNGVEESVKQAITRIIERR